MLFSAIFVLFSLSQSAQIDSLLDGMMQNLQPCVTMRFEMSTKSAISEKAAVSHGELKACNPDKFRLEMNDLTVVSDGKTMWRYSNRNKQLVIDDATGGQTYDPLTWLHRHKVDFKRTGAKQESLNGQKVWHIYFEEPQKNLNVSRFQLWIAAATLQPVAMTLDDGEGNTTSYRLRKIRPAGNMPKGTFTFQPPQGTEIFDQRNSGATE